MRLLSKRVTFLCGLGLVALAGCSQVENVFSPKEEKILSGDRVSIIELQKSIMADAAPEGQAPAALPALPAVWQNEFWPQAGGYPNHSMQHLALKEGALSVAWEVSIGEGSSDEIPLNAQPIVVDGRIFTMDTDSHLRAFDIKNGQQLWQVNVRPDDEDDAVIGGGVGFADGVLFATTGYDEVIALNPVNGTILWRRDIPAAARAAPTIMDGRLYIATLDNRLLALNPADGALLWEHAGLSESAGLVGAASPTATRNIVIPAFSSGEITALRVENGSVAWSENLAGVRSIGGISSLSDIKALPVVDNGVVIAFSFSGKMAAIDELSGNRIWQRDIGGSQTPWVAGDYIFALSSDNELMALNRTSGSILWVTQLDKYTDPDDLQGKILWAGPLLAGGRLILTGSDGRLVEFNPMTGAALAQSDLDRAMVIPPIVANGTLYILSENGMLAALR
jgi:outer membrane protein assembly factor BamB